MAIAESSKEVGYWEGGGACQSAKFLTLKLLYILICSAMAIAESSKEVGYWEGGGTC